MNRLYLGTLKSEKTEHIKEYIRSSERQVVVVDFNNEYGNETNEQFFLDKVNPLLGIIDIEDAKAVNAGYLKDSHCLHRMCAQILSETNDTSKEFLIEEAVERLHISWDIAENKYASFLSGRMPLKRNRFHVSLEKVIQELFDEEKLSLKAKNMHSYYSRAVIFSLLSRLSRSAQEPIDVVIDDISNLFQHSNLKLLLETMNLSNINFIFSYNKISNFPSLLLKHIDEVYVHKNEDLEILEDLDIFGVTNKRDLFKNKQGDFCILSAKETVHKE